MSLARRRPTVLALVVCLLTLTLAACGGTPGPAPAAPAVPPDHFRVAAERLPAGWRTSEPSEDGYRTTFCGVDLEPVAPVGSAHYRFARSPVGPFLEQYVRSYTASTAAEVVGAVQAALPGCRESEAAGDEDSPAVRFSVEPLSLPSDGASGPDTVAWRQQPAGGGVVNDVVLTRRGTTAVLLVAYGLRDEPDPAVLTAALAAVPQ